MRIPLNLCVLVAIVGTIAGPQGQAAKDTPATITITLTGQSMIRSDLRATAPEAVPVIQGLLKGDVVFTNFESTVAEKGETVEQGRGFLTPPEALDALGAFGFNLVAFASNHAFDLKATGIQNTIREADARKLVHAGTGSSAVEAAAPGYLRTPNGTIALVASASGLIAPGGNATADRPGVNELRVEAGGEAKRSDGGSARGAREHSQRRRCAAHTSEHSRGPPACGSRDRLPAQSCIRKPFFFDYFFRRNGGAPGAE